MHDFSCSPDRELVDAVLARRTGAFEHLIRRYQGLCWHIIQRMVRDPEDSRDLCQETFLRIHRCLHQYRYECALKSWVGRVAYTIARRYLDRKRVPLAEIGEADCLGGLENFSSSFDLEVAFTEEQAAARLHAAIESLPPLQRTLLTLHHLEDTSIPEISEITGLPSGTIKSHLFRARLRLREKLQRHQEN